MNSDFAKILIPLIDLTQLNGGDTPKTIEQLCHQAKTLYGSVAAVCIYPQFVEQVRFLLAGVPIKVATVANFPTGNQITAGLYGSQLNNRGSMKVLMKLTLLCLIKATSRECEGGQSIPGSLSRHVRPPGNFESDFRNRRLIKRDIIFDATNLAIRAGDDFIKTSTGKLPSGATIEAAEIILEAIQNHTNKRLGLKISGGIQTLEQAVLYIQLVKDKMGAAWITPQTLRFGASRLLADIMQSL
ncbi:deoxyribose-phosphate aldolase [Coxiella endosymbiont of Ornithodoros amblus]|uniref:deoxyribose-phosphate aldolase n=1 Tax=Coxiella endosymbiont of Ornithodoros amblus TaxID=1656166 RepID=UPI00244E0C9B|nr:deoxyribose-phosphate aldolase [Coxiella endosymbiont of Ornithodoros amblus]